MIMDFFGKISGMTENDVVMISNSVSYELENNPDLKPEYKKKLKELLIRLIALERSLWKLVCYFSNGRKK